MANLLKSPLAPQKVLTSHRGYSLPELMVAAGIVLMISTIVLTGIKAFSEQKKKINTTVLALSLQSNLHAAIKDLDNYPKPVQDILKGHLPNYDKISYASSWRTSDLSSNADRTFFTTGVPVAFNLKKEPVAIDDPTAVLNLYTQIKSLNDPSSKFSIYKMAYRIVFTDKKIPNLGAPLSASQAADQFQDTDFTETIPHEFYMGKNKIVGNTIGNVQCDPNVDIGIHGFNRDSGAPICIEKIYGDQPPKSFPRSLYFSEGTYADNQLGVKPHMGISYVLFKTYKPPQNYIFASIDTLAFDPASTTTGLIKYVFVYKKFSPFYSGGPAQGLNTISKYCPTKYYSVNKTSGICNIASTIPHNGTCTRDVPANPNDPDAGTVTETYSCAPDCQASSQLKEAGAGSVFQCTFSPTHCPNGGSWEAMLSVSSSSEDCKINVDEFQYSN